MVFSLAGEPITFSQFQNDGERYSPNASNKLSLPKVADAVSEVNNTTAGKNEQGSKFKEEDFTPIKLLSPQVASWQLCARLESKGQVRSFSKKNGKGEGKVVNGLFLDNSSRIQMVFWDKDVEKHYNKLEEGQAYYIQGAEVRKSSKYNNSGNQYELICNKETLIQPADEISSQEIKRYDVNVDSIRSIENQPLNTKLTVLGFALENPTKEQIKKKDGSFIDKIVLKVADQSQNSIDVVAWGDFGDALMKVVAKDVVLLNNLSLREFNQARNLSFYPESRIVIAPKVESKQLNDLIKFRNQLTDHTEINDFSKSSSNALKQGQSVLYSLKSIMEDAQRRILGGQ